MSIRTIEWIKNKVRIIDQTKLPLEFKYFDIKDIKTLWQALKSLQVRGAPAIGIAAAFGVVLGTKDSGARDFTQFKKELDAVVKFLASARPTAVNLFWALERMRQTAARNYRKSIPEIKRLLLEEAKEIFQEDRQICRRMAKFGASLLSNGDQILTICNAGALATADYGTALGVIYEAKKQGKPIKVYACETRPLLQGARLTTWELKKEGIDVTLICDNMAADLMRKGMVDIVIVGADRVAANGDSANKIGTYSLAVVAKYHKIPFYVAAPVSTFDLCLKRGSAIPIEERDPEEVSALLGRRIAPKGVKVYNPAFDVTPNALITAIICEKGIIKPPFEKNILKVLK